MHASLVLAVLLAGGAADRQEQALSEFDRAILAELERTAPAALPHATLAGEAYRARRWGDAIAAYERVLAVAPRFSHAARRICNARSALGDRAAALLRCREALGMEASAENEMALAHALATVPEGAEATAADKAEAGRLARSALKKDPRDVVEARLACTVALQIRDLALLRTCADGLRALAPEDAATGYFLALASAFEGDLAGSRAHLARAAAAGLDPGAVQELEAALDTAEPPHVRYGIPALKIGAAWMAGLALLVALGIALSAATLRSAARLARTPHEKASSGSRVLRRLYGAVLWASCAYYYASLPLVLLAVVGLGAAVGYGFMALGRIPVKLVLILALVVIATVWAVLKSLWVGVVRPREGDDPGLRLNAAANPDAADLLERVAARVGTRPVERVFLTPGTEIAVYEKGGMVRQLSGRAQRCLILGVGVLDGMTRGELKAVLAHEYGHLVNRDTAGGGFALAVRRSVLEMARSLGESGAATWYNPAWWFVQAFHRVFLRVSQGASRLQEILADRWAALAYGGKNFARGLEHVVERSIRFDAHAQRTLKEVIKGERALANLYRYAPEEQLDEAAVASAVAEALAAEPSPYDSHPRPKDRIAWVAGIEPAEPPEHDDAEPAWGIFPDREALERDMTELVRAAVGLNHGVTIPPEAPPSDDAAGAA